MKDITDTDLTTNIPLVHGASNWLKELLFIAGPCTVESENNLHCIASILKSVGVKYLRGGAYKPLTFPYRNGKMFELREEGINILYNVKHELGMKIVTEVVDVRLIDEVAQVADIIQIGSRNMYNYPLLEAAGKTGIPVMLKRHFGASMRDWLGAAEYLLNTKNDRIILCERGIVAPHTHSTTSRFIADIQVIPNVKRFTGLPVIIDPSHATFKRRIVPAITYAAMAAGADGVLLEAHNKPSQAAVDPLNAVNVTDVENIFTKSKQINELVYENSHYSTGRTTRELCDQVL